MSKEFKFIDVATTLKYRDRLARLLRDNDWRPEMWEVSQLLTRMNRSGDIDAMTMADDNELLELVEQEYIEPIWQ